MKRTAIAFLVAPLIPAALFAQSAGFGFSLVWSYACSYVFGIPVFLILRKKKKEGHGHYAVAGSLCGAAYILAINFADPVPVLGVAFLFALVGGATSLCFSLICGHERRRADPGATAQRP
jgi:hypothetical protein